VSYTKQRADDDDADDDHPWRRSPTPMPTAPYFPRSIYWVNPKLLVAQSKHQNLASAYTLYVRRIMNAKKHSAAGKNSVKSTVGTDSDVSKCDSFNSWDVKSDEHGGIMGAMMVRVSQCPVPCHRDVSATVQPKCLLHVYFML
jgi:hypothetical protein